MTQSPPPLDPSAAATLPYARPQASSEDIQHLNLLSIFHFILGPLALLFGTFPVIHLAIGFLILTGRFGSAPAGGPVAPEFVGWLFIGIASVFILLGWALGLTLIYAGLQLRRQRRRMFCMVVAAIECAFFPFGTVLGVFTLIVLSRPSVQALYVTR